MSQNLSSAAVVTGTLRVDALAVKGGSFIHMRVCDIAGVQRDECPYLVNWSIFVLAYFSARWVRPRYSPCVPLTTVGRMS